jgi:hypothetical protein
MGYFSNPSARGVYMLRKPFELVFIGLRVMTRHHEELPINYYPPGCSLQKASKDERLYLALVRMSPG